MLIRVVCPTLLRMGDHDAFAETDAGEALGAEQSGDADGFVVPPGRGAAAGVLSALAFTAAHELLISDIWASAPLMLGAGAACGALLAWSHALTTGGRGGTAGWWGYLGLHTGALCLLAVASVAVFEPITTMAAVIAANEPPGALISRALPLTLAEPVAVTVLAWPVYRRAWAGPVPVLAAATVLVLLLGLNVSIVGLVDIPATSLHLVAELLGGIVLLAAAFGIAAVVLRRRG